VIGQFLEAVDQNTGIVGSTTGSNYYVRYYLALGRICRGYGTYFSRPRREIAGITRNKQAGGWYCV
jgi:hypothetical protein